jgi:hypothetical protein
LLSASTDRRIAIAKFLTVTCALAIALPELSLTLPEIVPPATCARQTLPVNSATALTDASVKELETKAARIGFRSIATLLSLNEFALTEIRSPLSGGP